MKESIRRLVLFAVIVGTGSVLIFVNIPLIFLIPLIVVVGFALLILLGSITIDEIKSALSSLSKKRPQKESPQKGKISILDKLRAIKIGGKKPAEPKNAKERKTQVSTATKPPEKSGGIGAHFSLLISSVKSLGSIVSERKKPVKKVEEINKLLEHTISEKVTRGSALESASTVPAAAGPGLGNPAPEKTGSSDDADPFLSLSGEELETGLLDALDEPELSAPAAGSSPLDASPDTASMDSDLSMPDLEMPALPDDTNADAEAILAANAENGAEELPSLEGAEAIDNSLGDLDNINIEDIDLGEEAVESEPGPASAALAPSPGTGAAGGLIPATPITPAGAPDNIAEDPGDISSFAAGSGGPGSDEDMLSSLASDIKQVKKEKDVSLLRELKDFKAPATDIEKELQDMSEQLNAIGRDPKKKVTSPEGIK